MGNQREDRYGRCVGYVVYGQTRVGVHEARGYECVCGRLYECRYHRREWRIGGSSCRRPIDALVTERTRLAFLCEVRHDPLSRT